MKNKFNIGDLIIIGNEDEEDFINVGYIENNINKKIFINWVNTSSKEIFLEHLLNSYIKNWWKHIPV